MAWGNNTSPLDNATLEMFKDKTASISISVLYCFMTFINLLGNGLSLWLLGFCTSPKNSSIIFMINLTITDLAVGCILPFQIIYQLNGYNWTFGSRMCSMMTVLFYANMYCSILTMTAISIDRYLGIVRPMVFREMKWRKECAVIGCGVMWAIVLITLYPLQSTDLTYKVKELNITSCFDVLKKNMLPSIGHWALFLFTLFGILFLIPFVVTVFCYVSIIYTLVKTNKSVQKEKSLRLALSVLFVFIVCFAPNNIILLGHIIRRLFYDRSLYMPYKLSLSLSCLNSCLDPFIYYFASKDFRGKLREVLGMETISSGEGPEIEMHRGSIFSARSQPQGHTDDDVSATMYQNPESRVI